MVSYEREERQDPYAYPGSSVLKNRFGIKEQKTFSQLEYSATRVRINQLMTAPVRGDFNLEHLYAIHRHIFQDVYDWAGERRSGSLSKGGSTFAEPEYIASEAKKIFACLKGDNLLKGLEPSDFAERAANYFSDINALHPFREGNGRAIQTFLDQLAGLSGYQLDFAKVGREEWNEAARLSFHGNCKPMAQILKRIMVKGEAAVKPPSIKRKKPRGSSQKRI